MRLLQKGNKERTQEPTAANKTSSRSHALLMVNVKQTAKSRAQSRGAVKFGRLYMIDLAGSERASQTEVTNQLSKKLFLVFRMPRKQSRFTRRRWSHLTLFA